MKKPRRWRAPGPLLAMFTRVTSSAGYARNVYGFAELADEIRSWAFRFHTGLQKARPPRRLEEARLMRRPLVRAWGATARAFRYPAFFSGSAFRCELISSRSPASVSHVLARVA